MKIIFSKKLLPDPELFIRHCGYGKLFDRHTGQISYVKRLHGDLYPRFHAYVEDKGEEVVYNLHLDQRAPVYKGVTAHSGEYDGEAVEREAARIRSLLNKKDPS